MITPRFYDAAWWWSTTARTCYRKQFVDYLLRGRRRFDGQKVRQEPEAIKTASALKAPPNNTLSRF